jgi:hypothetical protein
VGVAGAIGPIGALRLDPSGREKYSGVDRLNGAWAMRRSRRING